MVCATVDGDGVVESDQVKSFKLHDGLPFHRFFSMSLSGYSPAGLDHP